MIRQVFNLLQWPKTNTYSLFFSPTLAAPQLIPQNISCTMIQAVASLLGP